MPSNAALRDFEDESPQYSVAHNLSRFDPRSRVREAALEMPAHQNVLSKPKTKAKTKTAERAYMRLSPMTVASFLAAAALLILIVFSCMQTSMLSLSNSKLSSQLNELKEEERRLNKQIDSTIDLAAVESYAAQELGMVKPDGNHIVYMDLSGGDHGVVYEEESSFAFVRDALSDAWEWLCDFFG